MRIYKGGNVISRDFSSERGGALPEYILIFALGGALYGLAELLWRARTHWTMVITGGVCFLMLYLVDEFALGWSFFAKCAYAAVFTTLIEFQVGCVVNRRLGWGVWNYSDLQGNIMGQICPAFSALWFLLAIPALILAGFLRRRLRSRQ